MDGEDLAFERAMKKAVALEEATNYPTGPPKIIKPSFEQYGEWLMEEGRFEEAGQQFDRALLRMPRRAKSLKGKFMALKAMDQAEDAEVVQDELNSVYQQADASVRDFLGK